MSPPKQTGSGRPIETAGRVKKDLLKVAIRLLSTLGREGATARAICNQARVGAPAMYHHYGDLNGLHQAAVNESFRMVAASYRRSARTKGPLQGIRDGWQTFMNFAIEEPRMCRIVIQKILIGEPPLAVASTLENVAKDMAMLKAQGIMSCSPEFAVELLWSGALGAACFTSIERGDVKKDVDLRKAQAIQQAMLDALLDSLVVNETKQQ
jgi:AcrR family transcriptional regulator